MSASSPTLAELLLALAGEGGTITVSLTKLPLEGDGQDATGYAQVATPPAGPQLGLATTRELLAELATRLDLLGSIDDDVRPAPDLAAVALGKIARLSAKVLDDEVLDYRTVGA